ncbi:hypothetical protein PR048_020537 [Dryococelus australis]|uniref:Pre-C2HC domain-containing protein n=1 Tax=Dryococelus australis TaxID=614101 RepID=A0ABQ9H6J1_9NEOP|nr:hypothetical protein PR048_020537 [Dryococelus australis]
MVATGIPLTNKFGSLAALNDNFMDVRSEGTLHSRASTVASKKRKGSSPDLTQIAKIPARNQLDAWVTAKGRKRVAHKPTDQGAAHHSQATGSMQAPHTKIGTPQTTNNSQNAQQKRIPGIFCRATFTSSELRTMKKHFGNLSVKMNGQETNFYPTNKTQHNTMMEFLTAKKAFPFTRPFKEDRNTNVVISNVPADMPPDELQMELQNLGFHIRRVRQFERKGENPVKFRKFQVTLEGTTQANYIMQLTRLDIYRVTVEKYRPLGPQQCRRCQE